MNELGRIGNVALKNVNGLPQKQDGTPNRSNKLFVLLGSTLVEGIEGPDQNTKCLAVGGRKCIDNLSQKLDLLGGSGEDILCKASVLETK
jgi:hypothetical protein